jgi:hypothetical protein
MAICGEAFGDSITEARFLIYFDDLIEFDFERVIKAFKRARRELKFFPKVSQLREFIFDDCESEYLVVNKDLIQIDYRAEPLNREIAQKFFEDLQKRLDQVDDSVLKGEQAEEFEQKRLAAKEKAKRLLS